MARRGVRGRGQHPTPVTDEEGLDQILMLLPGSNAAEFRKWAASILTRYHQGDTTLAEEIIDRASSTAKNNTAEHVDQDLLRQALTPKSPNLPK